MEYNLIDGPHDVSVPNVRSCGTKPRALRKVERPADSWFPHGGFLKYGPIAGWLIENPMKYGRFGGTPKK
jgi:hypothetical protein